MSATVHKDEIPLIDVQKDGALVDSQPAINFSASGGATVTVSSDAPNQRTNVLIDVTAGTVQPQDTFGNGADGALTLTQTTAAPAWATKSGSGTTTTFTLSRDIYATNLTLDDANGAFLLKTGGFRVFANGTLLIDANVIVHNDGNNASAMTPGGARVAGTIDTAVGGGSSGNTGVPGQATAVTGSIATMAATATALGGQGGGPAGGGIPGGTGVNASVNGNPNNIVQALTLLLQGSNTKFTGGAGGTGGSGGGTGNAGGGGGGGGGIVAIYARQLTNNGLIRSRGGDGGASPATTAAAGGGGSGQGGAIVLAYVDDISTVGATSVATGTPGAGHSTGRNGNAGQPGLVWLLPLVGTAGEKGDKGDKGDDGAPGIGGPANQYLSLTGFDDSALDLSGNTVVKQIVISSSTFPSVDLSGCTSLTSVSAESAGITSLNLSGATALAFLDVSSNDLAAGLDLAGLTALQTLQAAVTSLTTLDLTGLTLLTDVEVNGGGLVTQAAIDDMLVKLNLFGQSDGYFDATGNAPPSATGLAAKTSLEGRGWTVNVDS